MDTVKGEPIEAFDRSIDVHVSRIRAAIEDDPKKPRRVITIRGTSSGGRSAKHCEHTQRKRARSRRTSSSIFSCRR